ncbi:MAG: hypothetical protein WC528_02665 [Patescibacteria group bacterium]
MIYFRERNKLKKDYSGFQEVSNSLRNKLKTICEKYIIKGIGLGNENYYLDYDTIAYELKIHLDKGDILDIIDTETYENIFEAIEIFLKTAEGHVIQSVYEEILLNIARAFKLSGSVYKVNYDGEIELKIDESLAKSLKETEEILGGNKNAYETFFDATADLLKRKGKPEDIVKNIFVAFEDYLKNETHTNGFDKAISWLESKNIINGRQKSILEKIKSYRSDAYKVTHAGESSKPSEIDTLWYLDTVVAQLKFIDRKLKNTA